MTVRNIISISDNSHILEEFLSKHGSFELREDGYYIETEGCIDIELCDFFKKYNYRINHDYYECGLGKVGTVEHQGGISLGYSYTKEISPRSYATMLNYLVIEEEVSTDGVTVFFPLHVISNDEYILLIGENAMSIEDGVFVDDSSYYSVSSISVCDNQIVIMADGINQQIYFKEEE